MASKPFEPPESITLDQFSGLNNVRPPERLAMGELSIARNILIDDMRQMRVRQGYSREATGAHHSFREIAGRAFVVRDGVLGILSGGLTFSPLATVGTDPLSYTEVGDTVYASSVSWSGQISPTNAVSPWGDDDDPGSWISPVLTPTATLGPVAGRLLVAPPLASIVEEHNGRIYLAVGDVLWVTELFLYSKVDKHRNFIQFEHPITMLYSGGGGLYVGTEQKVYFLRGSFAQGMPMSTVLDAGAVPGSLAEVPAPMVHPGAGQQTIPEGDLPVFMSSVGICVGLDNGEVHNLTDGRVKFPAMARAAAAHRDEPGCSQYIVAGYDGTTWALNTRTKAVTEYTGYSFTGFAKVEGVMHAAAANGLYQLDGDDDDGAPIALRARSGLMRFGGTRLSRLKAAYVTARRSSVLTVTIETGDGVSYTYTVEPRPMRTARVHMGKGQRATHFLVDVQGSDLDLDMLELVPIIVQRRV